MDQSPWADAPDMPSIAPDMPSTLTGRLPNEGQRPTLPEEIKVFIVKGLACFDSPSEVVEAVYETFGIKISRQRVYRYDPANGQAPALRWRALHAATRQTFLQETAEIGITHRMYRLRILDRLVHYALENHYRDDAAAYLAQAAKECGGFYERRTPSAPLPPTPPDRSETSDSPDRLSPPRENAQSGKRAHEQRQCRGEWNGTRRVHDDVVEADAGTMGTGNAAVTHADRHGECEERDVCPTRERREIEAPESRVGDVQDCTGGRRELTAEVGRIAVLIPAGKVQTDKVEVSTGERKRYLLSTIAAMDHPDGIAARRAAIEGKV
jgi:hypothetical protein